MYLLLCTLTWDFPETTTCPTYCDFTKWKCTTDGITDYGIFSFLSSMIAYSVELNKRPVVEYPIASVILDKLITQNLHYHDGDASKSRAGSALAYRNTHVMSWVQQKCVTAHWWYLFGLLNAIVGEPWMVLNSIVQGLLWNTQTAQVFRKLFPLWHNPLQLLCRSIGTVSEQYTSREEHQRRTCPGPVRRTDTFCWYVIHSFYWICHSFISTNGRAYENCCRRCSIGYVVMNGRACENRTPDIVRGKKPHVLNWMGPAFDRWRFQLIMTIDEPSSWRWRSMSNRSNRWAFSHR